MRFETGPLQRYADVTERTAMETSPTPGELSYIANTGELDIFHAGAWRHVGAQVGSMQMLAGGAVPIGWLLCNGALVSRATYANLFAQIGTTWGAGDGSTTFALPDMRGKVPRGVAAATPGNVLGQNVGADTHAHSGPSHTHPAGTHTHHFDDTFTTSMNGGHDHGAGTEGAGHTPTGGGLAFVYGATMAGQSSSWHTHQYGTSAGTAHTHTGGVSATTDAGTGSTAAGGTQTTGSASSIQAGAAINFIIKI